MSSCFMHMRQYFAVYLTNENAAPFNTKFKSALYQVVNHTWNGEWNPTFGSDQSALIVLEGISSLSGEKPFSTGRLPSHTESAKSFRESVVSRWVRSPTRKERRFDLSRSQWLSRKGNKRRATNRRDWRQHHVAVVLWLPFCFLREHEKKTKKKEGEKGEMCLLILQDRNQACARER